MTHDTKAAYVEHVYDIIAKESDSLDSIYEDYIEYLVGTMGVYELVKHGYLESCGVINGRRLYVLIKEVNKA